MKLANAGARELADRDEDRPRNVGMKLANAGRGSWPTEGRPRNVGMELAECRARELAHRDEGRPRNEVCPRSGLVTHLLRRPKTMVNIPELDSEVCPRSGAATHHPRRPKTEATITELKGTAS
ncbi:MAG TPA: hypothetical protein VGR06_41145 [Actinophytocola sp.]|uniref:hypothetical protein n=1 Tax=Actinophytocola sp. TaxID=1872138 RepID=UPI002E0210EE|nr:hypothetical protein [Actinophytocola sp.]